MTTLNEIIVGLARNFGGGVGFESAVGRSRAWRKCFGREFWGGVIAYKATRLMLHGLLARHFGL